jgi:hypothetical protein
MDPPRAHIRLVTAIITLAVLITAPALHAAHGHGIISAADRMHAPCAACQTHSPAGTTPISPCGVLSLSVDCGAWAPETEALPCAIRLTPDGCRAPPSLLAN